MYVLYLPAPRECPTILISYPLLANSIRYPLIPYPSNMPSAPLYIPACTCPDSDSTYNVDMDDDIGVIVVESGRVSVSE